MTPPLWILLLAGAALVGVAACTTLRGTPADENFDVDQRYELRQSATIRKVGQRRLLVLPQKGEPVMVVAGTLLRVVTVTRDNTLTRGMEAWAEAELLDGAHRGERVYLVPDAKDWLRPAGRPASGDR